MNSIRTLPKRNAFTLIELMAAMAVFSILLVMLLRVFTGSVKTFHAGTGLSKQTSEARLVLDHLAAMMRTDVFSLDEFKSNAELKFYDAGTCEAEFIAASDAKPRDRIFVDTHGPALGPGADRAVKLLQEHNGTSSSNVPILDHIVDFQVSLHDWMLDENSLPEFRKLSKFPTAAGATPCTNTPVVAVIYLETLSDRNAKLAANAKANFDKRLNSQKYYRTVYLPNYHANK